MQLRKGVFEILVLSFISKKPMYGYEINAAINEFPEFEIPNGTIYPILRRLLKNEWATAYWMKSSSGPERKYYEITEEGGKILKDRIEFYRTLNDTLSSLE
nr:PadR family transcriptional regulator [Halobacillus trueperi]